MKILHGRCLLGAKPDSIGGKAVKLAALQAAGFSVPDFAVLPTEIYCEFIKQTNLCDKISFELKRKSFEDMRWEEIWDCSLRIRNMFLKQELPGPLWELLRCFFEQEFTDLPLVVRSSAPMEDSGAASFAGLHESYINVSGINDIINSVKRVWASLWSDAALLYRHELNLDIVSSSMAVIIQKLVQGSKSGIIFTRNPNDRETAVIEAVYGLNQGLVDGAVEPDRWIISRLTGGVDQVQVAAKEECLRAEGQGVTKVALGKGERERTVLDEAAVAEVFAAGMKCEEVFKSPQDVEWTYQNNLYLLQARPITTTADDDKNRAWYLSLRRSYTNLTALRVKIENTILPGMLEAAAQLDYSLDDLNDLELMAELIKRKQLFLKWKTVYWDELIPYAHGIRLFGQFYNDIVKPDDPYEFINLLKSQNLLSMERNRIIQQMVDIISSSRKMLDTLIDNQWPTGAGADELNRLKKLYIDKYSGGVEQEELKILMNTVRQCALRKNNGGTGPAQNNAKVLEEAFLSYFEGEGLDDARNLLDLGRSSYKLRDDDNIYLGKVEQQWQRAFELACNRVDSQGANSKLADWIDAERCTQSEREESQDNDEVEEDIATRQIVGQPAGPGIATGYARVIAHTDDLATIQQGEIIVCDAIDPKMTSVIPMVAAIVERRGGMLIHGAIIAREYGLPCVTGAPAAISRIKTGHRITVDGYLGIVTQHNTV